MELAYRLVIGAAVGLAALALGIHIYRQNPKGTPNRLALLICICMLERYAVSLYLLFSGIGATTIRTLLQVNSVFRYLLFPFSLHFYLHLKEKRGLAAWKLALIYVPAIFMLFLAVFLRTGATVYFSGGVWRAPLPLNDFQPIFLAFQLAYFALALYFAFRAWRQATLNREKRQAAVLLGSVLAYLAVTVAVGILFRGSPPPPDVGLYSRIIVLFGLYYAVAKYRFLSPEPSLVGEELIAHIHDMVLLLDGRQTVLMVNQTAAERLAGGRDDLKGASFSDLLAPDESMRGKLARFLRSAERSFESRIVYKTEGDDPVVTRTRFSKVTDRFSDPAGTLVISRELLGGKEFRRRYGLSEREMEIVDLVLAGDSARAIGEKLGISQRTVETHTANVCAKAGAANKAELFALCAKFGLLP